MNILIFFFLTLKPGKLFTLIRTLLVLDENSKEINRSSSPPTLPKRVVISHQVGDFVQKLAPGNIYTNNVATKRVSERGMLPMTTGKISNNI